MSFSGCRRLLCGRSKQLCRHCCHRGTGRVGTGRAGAAGIAVSFASINDRNYLDKIDRFIGQTLPQHVIPGLEPTRGMRPGSSSNGPKRGAPSAGRKSSALPASRRNESRPENTPAKGNSRIQRWGAPKAAKSVTVEYRGAGAGRSSRRMI